jgi:hypothetical protein
MGQPSVYQTNGYAKTNTTIRARVTDDAKAPLQQSALSSIAYTVTESQGPQQGAVTGSGSLSPVSTYLQNTLSTTGWFVDQTGFNFQATLPASCFPDPGQYMIDIIGTLSADGTTFVIGQCNHHAWSRS